MLLLHEEALTNLDPEYVTIKANLFEDK